jgi:glycosyltransferase involved in cell wall biosynthesis
MVHELHTHGLDLRYALDKSHVLHSIDVLSDKIFYNSQYTAQYYLPKFTFNKEASVIYPGGKINISSQVPTPFKTNGLKIVCVGQIKEQKGQIDAIKAAEVIKKKGIDLELLLIGGTSEDDKPYDDKLRKLIEKGALSGSVRLLGHSDNPAPLVKHADIALNCATNETFGRVTVEAMLCGTAVIGANSAGTAEIIDPGRTGLVYEPGNYEDLADKILSLYNDPALMKKLSISAASDTQHKYSDEERFKTFVEYLNSNPSRKSLDLTPLNSVFSDFRATISLANKKLPLTAKISVRAKKTAKRILRKG